MSDAYKWYGPGNTTFPHKVPFNNFISHGFGISDILSIFNYQVAGVSEGGRLYFSYSGIALILGASIVLFFKRSLTKKSMFLVFFCNAVYIIPTWFWLYFVRLASG